MEVLQREVHEVVAIFSIDDIRRLAFVFVHLLNFYLKFTWLDLPCHVMACQLCDGRSEACRIGKNPPFWFNIWPGKSVQDLNAREYANMA